MTEGMLCRKGGRVKKNHTVIVFTIIYVILYVRSMSIEGKHFFPHRGHDAGIWAEERLIEACEGSVLAGMVRGGLRR